MSEEPTTSDLMARVHRLFEAANRGDVDTAMSFFDPDAVWEIRGLGTSFEGVTAIRDFVEDWTGAYEEFRIDIEEMLELGHGVVLTLYHQEGRPIGASNYVRVRSAMVMLWVDGVIVRNTVYPESDIDEARAAAERLAKERG